VKREISNLPTSVLARLRNRARQTSVTFNQILVYYAFERFLYRLSLSKHTDKFVLKGALLLLTWPSGLRRTTRDIDLRAFIKPDIREISTILSEICREKAEPDGIEFDVDSIEAEFIAENVEHPSIRARFWAYIGKARVRMQIDFGFNDPITPDAEIIEYPTLLSMASPRLRAYPKETVVAEKLEAIVQLGGINSRMKDFYDLIHIARNFEFDGKLLIHAINQTFQSRETNIPDDVPIGFTAGFAGRNQSNWETFLRRIGEEESELSSLHDVLSELRAFLLPVLDAARGRNQLHRTWSPSTRWRS